MPYAAPEDLLAVAQYYQVTHLVVDKQRPGLRACIRAHPQVFHEVIQKPWPVYEIRWEALDASDVTELEDLKPLWDPRIGLGASESRLQERWEKASLDDR